jgi:hypothetical protein
MMPDSRWKDELALGSKKDSARSPTAERRFLRSSFILIAAILNVLLASNTAAAGTPASPQPPLKTDPIAQAPWPSVADCMLNCPKSTVSGP